MLLIKSSLEKVWSVLEDRKNLHKWEISIAILEMDICNGQPVHNFCMDYINYYDQSWSWSYDSHMIYLCSEFDSGP